MKTKVVVVAIIENERGQILLGRKKPNSGVYPNTWHNAGGGVEEGETLEQALRREVQEETKLTIKDFKPQAFLDDVAIKYTENGKEEFYYIFLPYSVKIGKGNPKAGSDFEEVRWFDKDELQHTKLNHPTKIRFRELGWIK